MVHSNRHMTMSVFLFNCIPAPLLLLCLVMKHINACCQATVFLKVLFKFFNVYCMCTYSFHVISKRSVQPKMYQDIVFYCY